MTDSKRYDNYINGEWVAGSDYSATSTVELSDTIGDYAKADLAQVHAAIDAARALPGMVDFGHSGPSRFQDKVVGNPRSSRRTRYSAGREEGKTLPEPSAK